MAIHRVTIPISPVHYGDAATIIWVLIRFVDNATFFRMKQLTVSYSLPKTLLKKTGLTRTEIYVTAYDLLTLTKYKGQNPEVGIPGGIYPLAIDNADTPRPVRIALGLTLDF